MTEDDQEFKYDLDLDEWMKERQSRQGTADPDAFMQRRAGQGLPALPTPPPGSAPTQKEMDKAFRTTGNTALKYAPAVLGTLGSIAAPEFLPATLAARTGLLGWGARTAAAATGAGVGGAAGSGIEQIADDKQLPFLERMKLAGKEGGKQAAGELAGQFIAAPFSAVGSIFNPKRLYQSALKPSGTLGAEGVDEVIKTGLREKIPVTEAGYHQTVATTDVLNKKIRSTIEAKSDMLGEIIDPESHVKKVKDMIPAWKKQVDPKADVEAIQGVNKRYLEGHTEQRPYTKLRTKPGPDGKPVPVISPEGGVIPVGEIGGSTEEYVRKLTALQAQEIKQGTYRQLRDKAYGELKGAEIEAQKGLARALREDLDKLFPELKALNARDKALIDLEQQLARFVTREGNKQMMGLTQSMIATAAIAGGEPISATGFGMGMVKHLIDNPGFKSKLAIALRHADKPLAVMRKVPKYVAPSAIRLGMEMDETGRPQPQLGTLGTPGLFARGGLLKATLRSLRG